MPCLLKISGTKKCCKYFVKIFKINTNIASNLPFLPFQLPSLNQQSDALNSVTPNALVNSKTSFIMYKVRVTI